MRKKSMIKMVLVGLGALLVHCNAAEDGFNAPTGTTVTFTDQPGPIDFPDEGPAGQCFPDQLRMATFQVLVPIGTTCGGVSPCGNPEGSSETTTPGNDIHGVVIQNGSLSIFRFKDGVKTFLPQNSLVDEIPAGTFAFVTDSRGTYNVVYQTFGCYDADGAIIAGTTSITADVGTARGAYSISVQ